MFKHVRERYTGLRNLGFSRPEAVFIVLFSPDLGIGSAYADRDTTSQ